MLRLGYGGRREVMMSFAGEWRELRSVFTRLSDIQQQKHFHVFIIYHHLLNAFKDCADTSHAFLFIFCCGNRPLYTDAPFCALRHSSTTCRASSWNPIPVPFLWALISVICFRCMPQKCLHKQAFEQMCLITLIVVFYYRLEGNLPSF